MNGKKGTPRFYYIAMAAARNEGKWRNTGSVLSTERFKVRAKRERKPRSRIIHSQNFTRIGCQMAIIVVTFLETSSDK